MNWPLSWNWKPGVVVVVTVTPPGNVVVVVVGVPGEVAVVWLEFWLELCAGHDAVAEADVLPCERPGPINAF